MRNWVSSAGGLRLTPATYGSNIVSSYESNRQLYLPLVYGQATRCGDLFCELDEIKLEPIGKIATIQEAVFYKE